MNGSEQVKRRGLGLGIDLIWGARVGFDRHPPGLELSERNLSRAGAPTMAVVNYLKRNRDDFAYMFCSFQPRDYGPLTAERYSSAYRQLFEAFGVEKPRALHHTIGTSWPEAAVLTAVPDLGGSSAVPSPRDGRARPRQSVLAQALGTAARSTVPRLLAAS